MSRVRHVRTESGVKTYHEPIGSPIVAHPDVPALHVEKTPSATIKAPVARKGKKTAPTPEMREIARQWLKDNAPSTENVVAMWDAGTDDEHEDGMNWYADAHSVAMGLAKNYNLTPNQAAGLIACYSPQTPWSTNMFYAARAMRDKKGIGGPGSHVKATNGQREWADRILKGERWQDVFSGQKIRAFANLIEHGDDSDTSDAAPVVVDRHAFSVASGDFADEVAYGAANLGGKRNYNAISSIFVDAAKQISEKTGSPVSGYQVQAATWLTRQRFNQMRTVSGKRGQATAKNAESALAQWTKFVAENHLTGVATEAPGTGYSRNGVQLANPQPGSTVAPYNGQGDPTAPIELQQPVNENELALAIAAILVAGYTAVKTVKSVAALLAPKWPDVPLPVVQQATIVALRITSSSADVPRTPKLDRRPGQIARHRIARNELYYRSAYVVNAVDRVAHELHDGESLQDATQHEAKLYELHRDAARNRKRSGDQIADAADQFGDELGWYLNPLLNNTPDCIAANGHNFLASEGTVIGYPGGVHPKCGCTAGPPISGAGSVNDAVHLARLANGPVKMKTKRAGRKVA